MINIPNSIRTKVVNLVDRLYDVWDDKDEFKKTLKELDDTLKQMMKLLPEKLENAFSYDGYAELFLIANYEKSENLYFYVDYYDFYRNSIPALFKKRPYTANDVLEDLLKRKDKLGKQISDFVYDWIRKEPDIDEVMLGDDEFCQLMLEYLDQKNLITLYTLDDIRDMHLPASDIEEAFDIDFLETLKMDQDIYYEIKEHYYEIKKTLGIDVQIFLAKLMFILDLCLNDYEDTVFYKFTLDLNNRIVVMAL